MESIWTLLHEILYLKLGQRIFGNDFSTNAKSVPWWQKAVLSIILFVVVGGALVIGMLVYETLLISPLVSLHSA